MTSRHRRNILAGLAIAAGLATHRAPAHPDMPPSMDTLIRAAAVIVEGEVADVSAAWNPAGTQIYTTVTLRVAALHKGAGAAPGEDVTITYLGGTVGETTLAILGQPGFRQGERAFLFLDPAWREGVAPFEQMHHGAFEVVADPAFGEEMLVSVSAMHTRASVIREIVTAVNGVGAGQ